MKRNFLILIGTALCSLFTTFGPAFAQGTAFTYQGRLNNGTNPANGSYDLRFAVYDALSAGAQQGSLLTNAAVAVSNGVFTVQLDFGTGIFNGNSRWLEIGGRTNGSATFATLIPRQPITATPYAIYASNAGNSTTATIASGVAANSIASAAIQNSTITATKIASGQVVKSLNDLTDAVTLSAGANVTLTPSGNTLTIAAAGSGASGWSLTGNAGTTPSVNFLGTTDDQPLEIKVNGQRVMRYEPNTNGAPNVTGGSPWNYVAPGVAGSFIGGGGATNYGVFSIPYINSISSDFGTIAGGFANVISTNVPYSIIGAGQYNIIQIQAHSSTISGGENNIIETLANFSTIGGGSGNVIRKNAYASTIAGGGNEIGTNSQRSTIGGGGGNKIDNYGVINSVICGGYYNFIQQGAYDSSISGGEGNSIQLNALMSTIGGGYYNTVGSNAYCAVISGGWQNRNKGSQSVVVGGYYNLVGGYYGSLGGGQYNTNLSYGGTLAGGEFNYVSGLDSALGGGYANIINGNRSCVPGGGFNVAYADYSFASGWRAKANHVGSFVWADYQDADFASTTTNQVSFRCQGGVRFTSASGAANQTVAWTPGSASWSFSSDRNLKELFTAVNAESILEKVSKLPLTEWNYKGYEQRHIGPMAQDFHALFPLNDNDKMLEDADLHGVALAAIQGLNQKLHEKDTEIEDLKQSVADLKKMVQSLAEKK